MRKILKFVFIGLFLFVCGTSFGAVYDVGPSRSLTSIADVPWATLQPGDTVLIHWRQTPYKEKWVICRQGSANAPITISGVPNANGDLPIIDGNGAVTPAGLNFWNEERGVIKIGGANIPSDTMPMHIIVENLEIRSAHPNYQFTNDGGNTQSYINNAAGIYVEKGENIVLRNNILHDNGNGLFIGSPNSTPSRDILIEGNYLHGNGVVGSAFYHNNYTAALNITFQFNRFGPLRPGADGNNLKDRSAGTVVRYNWIESGNRQLDLVDAEDSSVIAKAPEYQKTFVYGNVLIEPDGAGNSQIVHYGGDSGITSQYRKGKLYFYNNTVVSTRSGNTTLFRLSTNNESADARNNIFYVTATGNRLALLNAAGVLDLTHNWFKSGYRGSHGTVTGTINDAGTSVIDTVPGFVNASLQDFGLSDGSSATNAGTILHPDVLPAHAVSYEYKKHGQSATRQDDGQIDLGAFEKADLQISTTGLDSGRRGRGYRDQLLAAGGSGSYVWSVATGDLPPGLVLDPLTGSLWGKPMIKGNWTFLVEARDSQDTSLFVERELNITVTLYNN
ncbi:MAG: polysaccharide-degrading enzyme [Pyrinomonadaceae bacterium]|nr:polysaccharide-degrading enzyme [Pyrinomonadaceae bacterium]